MKEADMTRKLTSMQIGRMSGGGAALGLLAVLLSGCTVGPNYRRPAVAAPENFRGAIAPDIRTTAGTRSMGDDQWPAVFQDPALAQLIHEVLTNNLDLQIAAQRVLEARAQVGITRSEQFPSVSGGGSYSALQLPSGFPGTSNNGKAGNTFIHGGGPSASAAWNLDFWGLYRRQTEAARAELLASEWGQKAVQSTLMQDVALAYFNLRALDAQLEITESTTQARKESLELTQALEQHGAGSLADVRQAEELLHAAQANLRFPWACLRNCSNGGRISSRPRQSLSLPMPGSAPRAPSTSRKSRSRAWAVLQATNWVRSYLPRTHTGTQPDHLRYRTSTPVAFAATIT
jgi:hypothetical protein